LLSYVTGSEMEQLDVTDVAVGVHCVVIVV